MATTTESASELPPSAQEANLQALNDAMGETKITDNSTQPDDGGEKVDEGDSLEDGEIRDDEEEEEDDGKPKTVFDSAKKFNLKHPLYTRWTLYFDSPQSKMLPKTPSSTPATPQIAHGGWMEDMRKVVGFDSVEEFWGLYNNIVPPSQLPGKANYYLFRKDIMPAWEDTANKNGGKWSVQVPREKSKGSIDQYWLYTMLAAIGETLETAGESDPKDSEGLVTGVIISARPVFYRISIWTRSAPDLSQPDTDALKAKIIAMGKFFKGDVLSLDDEKRKVVAGGLATEVTFESHKDSEKKGNKNKLTI